jgi:signal transduction histidine kinase
MTAFQVILSFISAIFLTLGLVYSLRYLLFERQGGRFLYFAVSALGCCLFAFFQLLLSYDVDPVAALVFHRLKMAAMIMAMVFWFYCIYDIFFRSVRVPRIFLACGLLVALAIPFPCFLSLPVRHLQVMFLGIRFDYHFAAYGPAHWLMPLFVLGTYGFSIAKGLLAPLRGRDKALVVLAFVPGIIAGINDFAVGRGDRQGILLAEFVVFAYVLAILAAFAREERRAFSRLQAINAELERQVNERTRQLQRMNAELNAANQELRQANRLKTGLMGVAAEDLKNPLQSVQGYAELILRRADDGERVRRHAVVIQHSAERMLGLIDQLLEAAALESGEVRVQSRRVDLAELARRTAEASRAAVEAAGKRLEVASAGACPVYGDETRLQEIVENLIASAVHATPPGRSVHVRVDVNGPYVRLEVEDEGPGLSQDEQERVFEKFARPAPRSPGGDAIAGLGLYIVKKLIELQGGGIGIQSPPGKGSVFTVIFPRA